MVPLAKKLIQKGFPSYVAITFMTAAGVINPIVLISTYVGFRNSIPMLLGRVAVVIAVAAITGPIVSLLGKDTLKDDGGIICAHSLEQHNQSKIRSTLYHASNEFLEMGKYLIGGAFFAALIKTFTPGDILGLFQGNVPLAIVGMMLLAFLLSLCSGADSFVAASFVSFPKASQLAFVTLGPVLQLKLLAMYSGTFNKRVVLLLVIITFYLNLLFCNIFGIFVR